MKSSLIERLTEATAYVKKRAGDRSRVDVALVLGSGLGGFADALDGAVSIP
jgi:purine nucleoside phosphorylase